MAYSFKQTKKIYLFKELKSIFDCNTLSMLSTFQLRKQILQQETLMSHRVVLLNSTTGLTSHGLSTQGDKYIEYTGRGHQLTKHYLSIALLLFLLGYELLEDRNHV